MLHSLRLSIVSTRLTSSIIYSSFLLSALINIWKGAWETSGPRWKKMMSKRRKLGLNSIDSLTELYDVPRKFEAPFKRQLNRLLITDFETATRGEKLTRVSALLSLCYILFTGVFWRRMPNNTAWIFQRNSLLQQRLYKRHTLLSHPIVHSLCFELAALFCLLWLCLAFLQSDLCWI
jgi:hypothetical protein